MRNLLLVVSAIASIVAQAYQAEANGVLWNYDRVSGTPGYAVLTGIAAFDGGKRDIIVPDNLEGYPVKAIAQEAFKNTDITSIVIPSSVEAIGDMAFWGCNQLADSDGFVIVRGVLHYYTDKDYDVVIPGGVTKIGVNAFKDCEIESVWISPGTVTAIGSGAFSGCKDLESIYIPESVANIGSGAFWKCENLSDYDGYVIFRNVLYSYHGTAGNVTIPDGVTTISSRAFQGNAYMKSVSIPSSVTSIEAMAFANCANLASVTLHASVANIGMSAFVNTSSLTVHTEAGDSGRVSALLAWSAHDIGAMAFLEDIAAPSAVDMMDATWHTTRSEAFALAKKTGKKIFLLCGRDTCGNTQATKNYSCEEPDVKKMLVSKCVLWYSDCDTQDAETLRYWPAGTFSLPLVCVLDPYDENGFMVRSTGYLEGSEILAMLNGIPYPTGVQPEAAVDETDPFYPGEMTGYTVINPTAITQPIKTSAKAVTLNGALYSGNMVAGVIELKVGPLRDGEGKVSGSVTLLDGKKYTVKSQKHSFGEDLASSLNLSVKNLGSLRIAIGSANGVNTFSGSLGKWHVQSANVGGATQAPSIAATVNVSSTLMFPGDVLEEFLPENEVAAVAGGKWVFPKAAGIKWAKPTGGSTPSYLDSATGKGLIVDTSAGKTNLSGIKLTYTAKKGTFKGSFKLYAIETVAGKMKLKKYTVNITGVVVDGVGYGIAKCRRPAVSWNVVVNPR